MNIIHINSQKYEIIKKLGEGGFGKVYQVYSQKYKRYFAIKQILIDGKTKEEINEIKKKANILSNINTKYTVKYYDSFQDKNYFNILMEYYEKDLRQLLNEYKAKNKLIDQNIVYNIILGICLGIKEIHDNNIIHRDLKPENIFLNEDNEIKIGDFGISKQLEINDRYAYTTIGSNYYMAPEIIKGEKYNNKIDIWSFGCIIYELLTLNICFEDKSLLGLINKIIKEKHGNIDIKNMILNGKN